MSKSDGVGAFTNPLTKSKEIRFELKGTLPNKTDSTIKIKNVYNFLGAPLGKFNIVGFIKSYKHDKFTHYELTFIVVNKKTKITEKLVIDFTKKSNEKIGYGIVSLAVTPELDGTKQIITGIVGTPIVFTTSDKNKITNPVITFCDNPDNDETYPFCSGVPPT
jgi:hypothetical protein